ncbi:hypothetical protein D3C85_1782980 [compost metagenome]
MGVAALQCTLVEHVGLAVGHGVVNEQALLKVLAGIGEVEAEHFDLAAGSREAGGRRHADEVAPQADHDMLELRVAAQLGLLRG